MLGSSGEVRVRNIRPGPQVMKGFDKDCTFMLVEIAGDKLCYQVVSRPGETVDSGVIQREALRAGETQPSTDSAPHRPAVQP